jgi:hypothetical protein
MVVAWLACHTAGDCAEAPPPYFQKLIKAGNVRFEFYDPRKDPRPYAGYTEYELFVYHSYDLRYTRRRRGGGWRLTILPTVRKVTCRLTHTVHLPERLDSDDRWADPLVRHEFDHVAVSTDPRVRMLVEHLLLNLPEFERWAPGGTLLDDKFYRSAVDERIAERRKAVLQLVEANQQRLEEITRHGTRWTPDRQALFRSVYTEANLQETEFPYLADVKDLLRSEAYRNAELLYALDDKEANRE